MTSITPQIPAMQGVPRDPRGPVQSGGSRPGYPSTVSPQGRALPEPATGRADEAALRSGLAHVFNAYGFFAADEPLQDGSAALPGAALSGTPTDAAPAGDGPCPPEDRATLPQVSLPAQASERAHQLHEAGGVPGATPPTHLAEPGAQTVGSFVRALENRLENVPDRPETTGASAPERRDAQAGRSDQVTLKIAEHGMELIGRLSNLGDDERQRLLDEVQALLAEHGLSLAGTTLNGESFAPVGRP